MRIGRALGAVLLAGAVATVLAGCDQFIPDPVAFTLVDGTPVVRICAPVTITDVEVTDLVGEADMRVPANTAGPLHDELVWDAHGSFSAPAGTEFALESTPPAGLTVIADGSHNRGSGREEIRLELSSVAGGSWQTESELDRSMLQPGIWLDGYGQVTDAPCTHEPCDPLAACFDNWPIPTGHATELQPTFTPSPSSPPSSH